MENIEIKHENNNTIIIKNKNETKNEVNMYNIAFHLVLFFDVLCIAVVLLLIVRKASIQQTLLVN